MSKDALFELKPYALINGNMEPLTHVPLEEADPKKLVVGTFMIWKSEVFKLNPGRRMNPPFTLKVLPQAGIINTSEAVDQPKANLN